ncbi:hypothetical protein B0H67DRAFT_18233 [Lasiosphaeris hirsuta]|uniref:Uncharacterized protein n=1 Tax=Lasiosphaeris hirsuta TaxID=260670 RepID=A0AA40B968_9PEZI|nr:hypothetical protein B0H67DRAFT_18233 [Lasiosphaeris hirsuta]
MGRETARGYWSITDLVQAIHKISKYRWRIRIPAPHASRRNTSRNRRDLFLGQPEYSKTYNRLEPDRPTCTSKEAVTVEKHNRVDINPEQDQTLKEGALSSEKGSGKLSLAAGRTNLAEMSSQHYQSHGRPLRVATDTPYWMFHNIDDKKVQDI